MRWLFLLLISFQTLAQSTKVNVVGARDVPSALTAFGTNIGDGQIESIAAQAAGITHGRTSSCGWTAVESQSAPPANTSSGYALSSVCSNDLIYMASHGITPDLVAAYGAPYHTILNTATTATAAAGSNQLALVFSSGVGGDTMANIVPGDYVCPAGVCTILTAKHSYPGILITGVTCSDSTHCVVTLASALCKTGVNTGCNSSTPVVGLASGSVITITEQLYPPAITALYSSDTSIQAYVNYVTHLFTLSDAITSTYGIHPHIALWNEPPWGGDCWDNYVDCYDTFTGTASVSGNVLTVASVTSNQILAVGYAIQMTGLPGYTAYNNQFATITGLGTGTGGVGTYTISYTASSAISTESITAFPHFTNGQYPTWPNYGFADAMQNTTIPTGAQVVWAGTDKSTAANLVGSGSRMVPSTGHSFTNPSVQILVQSIHPYGNNPEDYGWLSPCLTQNPNLGSVCSLTGTGFQGVAQQTLLARQTCPTCGINWAITESGQSTANGATITQIARYDTRQALICLADQFKYCEFYRLFDTTNNPKTGFSYITVTNADGSVALTQTQQLASTTFMPLAPYTAQLGLYNDLNTIKYAPPVPVSLAMLAGLSNISYSGTYPLDVMLFAGGVSSTSTTNAYAYVLYQQSYNASSWITLASPAAVNVTIPIPPGYYVSQVVNLDTRVTQPASNTVSVADDPIEVIMLPLPSALTIRSAVGLRAIRF